MGFKKLKETEKRPKGQDSFFKTLLNDLPPTIPRKELPKYIGNLISVGYLANLDSAGLGPEYRRIGGSVVYERESFVQWLESRTGDS